MNQVEQELRKQNNLRALGVLKTNKQEVIHITVGDLIGMLLEVKLSLPVAIHRGESLIVYLVGLDMSMKEHIDAVKHADSQLQAGLLAASLGLNPDIRGMIMNLHNALKLLLAELPKGTTEGHGNSEGDI